MNTVTILWSVVSGACAMLALLHLVVWLKNRRSWENLFFPIAVLGVVGLAACELVTMNARSTGDYAAGVRYAHLIYILNVVGMLGFVHCHFGTGRKWLLWLALGLRVLAVVANFSTGQSLHIREIHSLRQMTFLGETVTILGEWEPNRWILLGQASSLVMVTYLVDASRRLWRTGSAEGRRRALFLGGSLTFFVMFASVQAGLVATGVLRMPFLVSLPFLGMLLAMGYELSRNLLRSMDLSRNLGITEQRLAQAAAAARLALWEWDIRADRIWVSAEGRMLYGLEPNMQVDFKRFAATLHPEDRPKVTRAVDAALAGPEPFAADYRVLLPDGGFRWIAAGGRVERDAQGRAELLRGVSIDVTERRQAELELARQQGELAHLSRVSILGELAGALAHELNQPLAAILGNAQVGGRILRDPTPDMDEVAAILADVADDAKRAGGIIHGMRAMFKKDSVAEVQPVDLNEAVGQVLALLHSEIIGRRVKVDLIPGDGLPPAAAGRVEVQQVVMNLVINGLDAMKQLPPGGRLAISTGQLDGQLVVSVHDSGPGIPPEMMDRLFEPFVSSKHGGLGLGLAISRSIAERFRGKLLVENHSDGGAEFRLLLPAAST